MATGADATAFTTEAAAASADSAASNVEAVAFTGEAAPHADEAALHAKTETLPAEVAAAAVSTSIADREITQEPAVPVKPSVVHDSGRHAAVASDLDDVDMLPMKRSKGSVIAALVLAAVVIGSLGLWLSGRSSSGSPEAETTPATKAATPVAAKPEQQPQAAPPIPPPAPSPAETATAAPEPVATATTSATSGSSAGITRVTLKSSPPGGRFFEKGKEVGSGGEVLVELSPGQKRTFEVGMPGYGTRKVIVDGSKDTLTIGLKPNDEAPRKVAPKPPAPKTSAAPAETATPAATGTSTAGTAAAATAAPKPSATQAAPTATSEEKKSATP